MRKWVSIYEHNEENGRYYKDFIKNIFNPNNEECTERELNICTKQKNVKILLF